MESDGPTDEHIMPESLLSRIIYSLEYAQVSNIF